jgi:hypothetical protein
MNTTLLIRFDTGIQQWIRSDRPYEAAWSDKVFKALMARDFPDLLPIKDDLTYRLTIKDGRPVQAEVVPG